MNLASESGYKSNPGGFGFVCSQHFSSDDIQKSNKRIQLKKGSIPICTNAKQDHETSINDENENANDEPSIRVPQIIEKGDSCKNCCILLVECEELKKSLLKQRLNSEIKILKKEKEIEKMLNKCRAQSDTIDGMKVKINVLEKSINVHKLQIENLRDQKLRLMNVADTDVTNSITIYLIIITFVRKYLFNL